MRRRSAAFVVVAFLAFHFTVLSQDLPDVAQGLQPYVAYHGGQLDQVNTWNGGLTVRIPLVSYPQKGSLSLSYSVIFNSFGFEDIGSCIAAPDPTGPIDGIPLRNGCTNDIDLIPTGIFGMLPLSPRVVADQLLQAGGVSQPQTLYVVNPPTNGRLYVVTADNAEHALGAAADGSWRSIDGSSFKFVPSQSLDDMGFAQGAYAGDTSRLMAQVAGTITDSRGITYTPTGMTDLDGNSIAISSGGLPATDSTGRAIPAPVDAGGTSGCPTIAGATNQPLSSATKWTPPGTGNGYLFCYASVSIDSTPQFSYIHTGTGTQYRRTVGMLQSVVLPNGTHWAFIYDSYAGTGTQTGSGQLTTLIYPTGGAVTYTYTTSLEGSCRPVRESGLVPATVFTFPNSVTSRTLTDVQGWSAKWTYIYPNGQYGAQVLSPAGDLTVTKWTDDGSGSECGFVTAGENVYQGNPANPALVTPLKSTTITYSGSAQPTNGPPYVSTMRISKETTVLGGTSTSSVQYGYATMNLTGLECDGHFLNCIADESGPVAIGGETSKTYNDYDGTVLKEDATMYQWQNAQSYFNANLLDLPFVTQTLDAAGTPQATTTYKYDESSYSAAGIKGHPTTATKSLLTNTTASPAIHTGWNSSGEKAYVIDADGNKNQYGHTADYTYGACNGSAVTDTYDALNDHVSGTYDCDSGRLTSYTDANSKETDVVYDGMGRITSVTYPAIPISGNQTARPTTTFTYNDSSDQVIRSILATPDPTQTTTVSFDGFGREIQRLTATSGTSPITVDTAYDADGRVHSVSNPYYATTDATYGLTVYAYDALSRKTSQTQPDSTNTLQWTYSGNVVTSTDELSHTHQSTSDALGRLTKVLEPNPTNGSLNLETDYSYNPPGNLVAVNQLGNANSGDTARSRSFAYDSLSRLVTAYNPESGWTCYGTTGGVAPNGSNCANGYDANGNLLDKTDARGVTAAYSYDALNRLISRSYQHDSTATPTSCYQYGLPTTGTTGANQIGRLMNSWTQAGTCPQTGALPASGYLTLKAVTQYDAMGHIVSESQCAPSGCQSGVPYAISYGYDLAGNPASSTNGIPATPGTTVPLTFTSAYDAAGRFASVTSNWNGNAAMHPATLFSATGYSAAGGLTSASFGNGLTLGRTYNSRLWVTGETDTGGLVLNATPGTATITINGAEQSH